MNYLMSKFHCTIDNGKKFEIIPNALYSIKNIDNCPSVVYGHNGELPFAINFLQCSKNQCENVICISDTDNLFILYPIYSNIAESVNIKYQTYKVNVSVSTKLVISIDDEIVVEEDCVVKYSHCEIRDDILIIYFDGKRKYAVAIQKKEKKFATYYDEINVGSDELLIMCALHDTLNHGRVFEIKNKEVSSYLVYLDDYDMTVRDELLPFVFLDAVKSGNLKYANNMLEDNIKMENCDDIKKFFPDFDDFVFFRNRFFLINKNALSGKFDFNIQNGKISNIIDLN